jgi:hypothetical protein
MQMTTQDIEQVKKEIEDFKAKSTQFATSSPAMSAHYHRLYMASKGSLKRFDRMTRSLENKAYIEQRKKALKSSNKTASTATPQKSA